MSDKEKLNGATKAVNNYLKLKAEFEDFCENEVTLEFDFQKPTSSQIERCNKMVAQSKSATGARPLLLWTIQPDQKEALVAAMDEYPGIIQTFSDEIYKRMGFGSLGK